MLIYAPIVVGCVEEFSASQGLWFALTQILGNELTGNKESKEEMLLVEENQYNFFLTGGSWKVNAPFLQQELRLFNNIY